MRIGSPGARDCWGGLFATRRSLKLENLGSDMGKLSDNGGFHRIGPPGAAIDRLGPPLDRKTAQEPRGPRDGPERSGLLPVQEGVDGRLTRGLRLMPRNLAATRPTGKYGNQRFQTDLIAASAVEEYLGLDGALQVEGAAGAFFGHLRASLGRFTTLVFHIRVRIKKRLDSGLKKD
jgi:hypothetical protein